MAKIVCPVCGEKLNINGKSATCANRHCFDRAREGYFYLLPPNDKNSSSPGDNRDMLLSRETFLGTDSYLPLAKRLTELLDSRFDGGVTLLDAGVGTGYYLQKISEARGHKDDLIGADISKFAAKRAARANRDAFIAVASVFSLPVEEESVDAVLSVFSPFADKQFALALKSGGILLAAVPAERHLIELRSALYDDVRPVESVLTSQYLTQIAREELTYEFELTSSEEISSLLAMTPYVYRAPMSRVDAVRKLDKMRFTADFLIYTFAKP